MKKFLALVMAMVMAFSLMLTVNAADQVKDWTDKDQVTEEFTKAVDVLSGMEIFQGDDTGTLRPGDTISRAEVAALIYRAATGDTGDTRAEMYRTYAPFTDVKPDDWFAGYVGYCWNAGYIKGTTATTFNPYEKVTGYEVLAMILRAVGYDKNHEFEGGQWIVNVASIANDKKVTKDVKTTIYGDTLHTAARRDVVASLLFNAIQIDTVTYTPALGYETDRLNGSNKSLGEIWFNLKHVDGGVIVGNQDTGESKTIVNKAKKDIPDHYSYFYNTKNWDEDLTAGTGKAATVETADSWKIDAKTGIDMFGHKVEVYFNEVSGKTFALYDNVKKTALVTVSDPAAAGKAALSDSTYTAADVATKALLGQAALDAGFKVDKTSSKAVFNQSFGVSGAKADLVNTANSSTDYSAAGDTATAANVAKIKTNAVSLTQKGSDGTTAYPLYLLISNNSDLTVDMVVALNVVASQVEQVNNYGTFPSVTVTLNKNDGTTQNDWNYKLRNMIEQKALTATSNKGLGDKVVGVAIVGTDGGFTPTANSTVVDLAAGAKSTNNLLYRLSTPTSVIEGAATGYKYDSTTHTGSVTINGKVIERSLLADAIVGYDGTTDSSRAGGATQPRGINTADQNAGLSPDTGDYGNYRLYLDAEGKYIWAEPIVSNEFIYGTYVDYQTAYGSSTYEYTMVGINLKGEQVKRVVKTIDGKAIDNAAYTATGPATQKLGVPSRDTNGGTAAVNPGSYVGFNISESGALTGANAGAAATDDDWLPGAPKVYRADGTGSILQATENVTTEDAKLGMLDVNSKGLYFTNSTKFIVVDGAGTDTQKVEIYTGMTELLDGASNVEISFDLADGTSAGRTAGHGWASKYLVSTVTKLNQMTYYTKSPFTYASVSGRGEQIDTIIIPKAALTWSGRSNLVYMGRNTADSVTYLGDNSVATNAKYLYTLYKDGEAGQYWVDSTANTNLSAAADKFFELEDSGTKMPNGETIWTCGAALKPVYDGNSRPDVNDMVTAGGGSPTNPRVPIIEQGKYWAATYSAQTATIDTTGKTADGTVGVGSYRVDGAKVVNLNTKDAANYIWPNISDLGSLNDAASNGGVYQGTGLLPRVSAVVDPTDPMRVTVIYICWTQDAVTP